MELLFQKLIPTYGIKIPTFFPQNIPQTYMYTVVVELRTVLVVDAGILQFLFVEE